MTSRLARPRSPFTGVLPGVAAAGASLVAAAVWVAAGDRLPGGRWLAVHLFTLGVLTNVVLAFTNHFATTLTHQAQERSPRWQLLVFNAGVVAVLVGLPTGRRPLVAVGATTATAVVAVAWWRLRTMRRTAPGARFAWIVRTYERAHGAFLHGAVLGALLGTGALTGSWYAAGRLAHLHVNLLGWGGLTLLATLVFFGPTVARTRIVPGADDRAARDLRRAATALTVATLGLLATGAGGGAATVARIVAAIGLAVYAAMATRVCRDVLSAARAARPTAGRATVIAVTVWLPLVLWADVALVATRAWRHLDALGLAMILGVLLQAVVLTMGHVAPTLRRDRSARAAVLERIDRRVAPRLVLHNLGVALVVGAAVVDTSGAAAAGRAGWFALGVAVLWFAIVVAVPSPVSGDGT